MIHLKSAPELSNQPGPLLIFVCVIALQIERWMRRKLATVSVPKAIESLQRIKVGEIEIGGKKTQAVCRPTAEQKALLAVLGVPPVPATL